MKQFNMIVKEETLDNGLHVILVKKPGYYRSLFMLAVNAGGFDIEQQYNDLHLHHRSGCAHFLEHQMFRLDGQDVTNQFAQMQASTNAFTTNNKTAYYFQTTADIEAPLNLLCDFVEELDIDTKSVNKEKGIILSEYDMYQQQPEQRLFKETWKSLYVNHPLRYDVLGTPEDISNMRVEDLSTFYHYNYDPSKLTLVGITGQDIDKIMDIIKENQTRHPSLLNGEVKRIIHSEPDSCARSKFSCAMDISTPFVCVGYKEKTETDIHLAIKKDQCIQMALDAAMTSLNPTYQTWLDNEIMTNINGAECDFNVDHSAILYYAQTHHPDAYIKMIDAMSKEFSKGMDPSIFKALKARAIAQMIRGFDSFENLAVELLEAHISGYDYWKQYEMITNLEVEQINAYLQTLDLEHPTITTIQPKNM